MARTRTVDFVVNEDGIIEQGSIELRLTLGKGTGADKVVYMKDFCHTLDYTGCNIDDLADSAASADTISLQNSVWRGLEYAVKDEHNGTTSMKDWYSRTIQRGPVDPMKAIDKMDDAQLKALMEKLQAKLGK
jgi:hypothetical protein